MVGQAGLEPAVLKAPDLQSGGVTNFPTDPYIIIKMPALKSLVIENCTSQRMPVWPNAKLGAAVLQLLRYGGGGRPWT